MNLREYLFLKRLSVTAFSKVVECNRPYLSKIANGSRMPGKRLAKDIERATEGEVTAVELLQTKENREPLNG